MKLVSPFRPFVPESPAHRKLGPFDWVGALEMLFSSAQLTNGCQTYAITDVDTDLPVSAYHYETTERRLMLWILDVSRCYLESKDFDQDTVMVSPDMLVFQDLRPWFTADLGVLVRSALKYPGKPLLNGVQFWRHAGQDRLVAFYRKALAIAQTLPENSLRWGADTVPLVRLLSPIELGISQRAGLTVSCIDREEVLDSINVGDLEPGHAPPRPVFAVSDFKGPQRKKLMRAYYDATIGSQVLA